MMATTRVISVIICTLVICQVKSTDIKDGRNKKTNRLNRADINRLRRTMGVLQEDVEGSKDMMKTIDNRINTIDHMLLNLIADTGTKLEIQEATIRLVDRQLNNIGLQSRAQCIANEQIFKVLENLGEKQSILETENQELRRKINEMEQGNKYMLDYTDTEHQKAQGTVSEMQNDTQQGLNDMVAENKVSTGRSEEAKISTEQGLNSFDTENKELGHELKKIVQIICKETLSHLETEKQTLRQTSREMEGENTDMTEELATVQATTTITTTLTTGTTTPDPCNEGWRSFQHHCYLIVEKNKSWKKASAFC